MTLRLRYAARSDVGLVRSGNEDSGYAGPRLLVVADGMGGHAAGELASATAVATLAQLELEPPAPGDVLAEMADSIDATGESIRRVIAQEPDLTGMGTTVTSIYWLGERIAVVHVGDSRAYLLRDGELSQLTHDHTYVQTLIDAGSITEEEAAFHPRRSLILRALDGINPVEPDLSVREARVGDRYLLCSDGLSGVMTADEIASRLRAKDPTGAVTALVDLALERGAPDNVTVVVADVVEVDDEQPDEMPVVVGAAGEPRVRDRLPGVAFPDDAQPDPEQPDAGAAGRDGGAPRLQVPLFREQPRRRGWITGLVIAVVVVIVLALATAIAANWVSSRWYVALNGSAGTGTVAIYNGVQGSLLGVDLSQVSADSGIGVGSLPLFDQELVSKGIPASSRADADRIVAELRARADACDTPLPPAGCPGAVLP